MGLLISVRMPKKPPILNNNIAISSWWTHFASRDFLISLPTHQLLSRGSIIAGIQESSTHRFQSLNESEDVSFYFARPMSWRIAYWHGMWIPIENQLSCACMIHSLGRIWEVWQILLEDIATEILLGNVTRWTPISSGNCHWVADVKLTGTNTSATRRTDARPPGWGNPQEVTVSSSVVDSKSWIRTFKYMYMRNSSWVFNSSNPSRDV